MRRFGVEIEFGGLTPQCNTALVNEGLMESASMHSYYGNSPTHWVMKTDASVPGGGELVSPPLNFDDPEQRAQVNKACKVLRDNGGRTYDRAGIHVHIDCSDMTGAQIASLVRTFTKFEDILYRIASSGWRSMRPGAGTFCKPLTDAQIVALSKCKTKEQVERAYAGGNGVLSGHGHGSRYHALNLQSWFYRGTVEFRLFNSSLNGDRIQAYIAVCMALVDDARRGKMRSINKAFRLGGMLEGTTSEKSAYHRFQQVVRYEAGMSIEDYKLMNRCWKDSVPQRRFA